MPYSLAEEFLPKAKLKRAFGADAVIQNAGDLWQAAREAAASPPADAIFKPQPPVDMPSSERAQAEADRQRSMAESPYGAGQQIRSLAPATTSTTHGIIDSLLQRSSPPQAPLPPMEHIYAPQRQVSDVRDGGQRQLYPDRGNAPATRQNLPDRNGSAAPQTMNYSLVDQVLSTRNAAPPAASAAAPSGDLESWARAEAKRLGIDENKAIEVGNTEGGFKEAARQNMEGAPAFGPYQMYVGGPKNPGLGDEMLQRGIDPRKPENARAAITFALEHAAKNGWGAFQGAAAHGIGDWDGITRGAKPTGPAPVSAMSQPQDSNFSFVDQVLSARSKPADVKVQAAQAAGVPTASVQVTQGGADWRVKGASLSANQYEVAKSLGLGKDVADALCGPTAVEAFVRATGREPDYAEAIRLKEQVGWTADLGMTRGSDGVVDLLKLRGVEARKEKLDWSKVQQTVAGGQPVIVNTKGGGGHFWVAQGFNPATGEYDFGNSAAILRLTGGRRWLKPEEMAKMNVGTPSEAIYMGGS